MSRFLALPYQQEAYTERTEAQLIEEAKTNPQCFEPLYARYVAKIYQYMRTRTSSDEDAADLTQQVFLQALHALPKYRSQGKPFAAWLFRIAQCTAASKFRKRKDALSWDLLPEAFHYSLEQEPETLLLHQEHFTRLRQLLSSLSPSKRELLALRYAAGLSSSEIALVVGKSHASVKKQLTRILHTLKECYHDA